jgi:hypothetical protein
LSPLLWQIHQLYSPHCGLSGSRRRTVGAGIAGRQDTVRSARHRTVPWRCGCGAILCIAQFVLQSRA